MFEDSEHLSLREHELASLLKAWKIPFPASFEPRTTHTFLLSLPIKSRLKRAPIAPNHREVSMKRCIYEYHPTILSSTGLASRLTTELQFTLRRLKNEWPELKGDPIGFGKLAVSEFAVLLKERLTVQHVAPVLTAVIIVLTAVIVVVMIDKIGIQDDRTAHNSDSSEILIFPISDQSVKPLSGGVGTGSQGRVGFRSGAGEGSAPKFKRSKGGGSSGNGDKSDPQIGKIPPPSLIPAPIPQFPPARKQVLPVAGMDIDPALWANLAAPVYGDPRSSSTIPSNGPGINGGMGTNSGTGIGEGIGDGFGPGSDGNIGGGKRDIGGGRVGGGKGDGSEDPNQVLPVSMVTQRARVLSKPEPQFTDEARRNQITGTVVLRVVFSRTGQVTNIRAVNTLPFGLTERAIAAARQIRFLPAMKGSRAVSVYMQLEYNFNLY